MTYGIPYRGSKTKIAKQILDVLPAGNRLVDLFGGGCAVTYCAAVTFPGKWSSILYNDADTLTVNLIKNTIDGKYNYNVFHPDWISRERFNKEKFTDGYIKWIWSFGNNGSGYLFGRTIEEKKRQMHEYVVNGVKPTLPELTALGIKLTGTDIHSRRRQWTGTVLQMAKNQEKTNLNARLQELEQLERLQQLNFTQPPDIEITNTDYREYKYSDGDIVYCDIPYEHSDRKGYIPFDPAEFYKWAREQPYDVYFSSYKGNSSDGEVIWERTQRTTMNNRDNTVMRTEQLIKI